jgi:hypothetical protein
VPADFNLVRSYRSHFLLFFRGCTCEAIEAARRIETLATIRVVKVKIFLDINEKGKTTRE